MFSFLLLSLYACFAVAVLFTIRLHRMTGEGIAFLKYIKFFFLSLSAYLLLHILEIRFGAMLSPRIIKVLYFCIKAALLSSSVFAALITVSLYSVEKLKAAEKFLALGVAFSLVFLYFDFPAYSFVGRVSWSRTVASTIITVVMAITYLSAVIAFYSFAFKRPQEKKKLLQLGTAFLLMFLGGPLHVVGGTTAASLANILELISFTLIAIPLFVKPRVRPGLHG